MMRMDKLVLRPKPHRRKGGYKLFSVRVREDIVDRVDDIAVRTGCSRNELIGVFLDYAAANCLIEEAEET